MMYSADQKLPDTIPIFPLSGVLLLPKGQLPLNIFEPRYIEMVDNALSSHRLIGMIQPKSADNDAPNATYSIGCAGRITGFEETEDGRYLINLTGISRFDIVKEISVATNYRQIQPSWSDYDHDREGCKTCGIDMDNFLKTLDQYFCKMDMTCEKWNEIKDIDQERLIAMLSMVCPFSSEEKQALLEAKTVKDRAAMITALMEMHIKQLGDAPLKH